MEDKMQKRSTKEMEIKFRGKLEFEGPVSEFEAVMADLGKLSARGLMIGTWPTPEHPAGGLMIDTVPLPEQPLPGIVPVARYLSRDLLNKLTEGMPRFKIIKDINGGIRSAHLHLQDEVVLLDRAGFKEAVTHVATELAGKLAETAEYTETIGAISHLVPGVK